MHIHRKHAVALAGLGLAACVSSDSADTVPDNLEVSAKYLRSPHPIAGKYIILFDESRPDVSRDNAEQIAAELTHRDGKVLAVYKHAMLGYWAELDERNVAFLLRHPRVLSVTEDAATSPMAVQNAPTWGIGRIDERKNFSNGAYQYSGTGEGVHVYVLDSGLHATHNEFTGRTGPGFFAIQDGNLTADCNGHGTHVSGTIGGTNYGVAKGVTLHPVRVLDCAGSGSTGGVIAGVDWITGNHVKPAVVNASLSGASNLMDTAIRNSIAAGITYVVAAGNDNIDACNRSPARVEQAVTVGATDRFDQLAPFSNWGACVDISAPGVEITSAAHTSNNGTSILDGTSMAAPHVTGVAALYLQRHPNATPAEVHAAIVGRSTQGVLGNLRGTVNRLLYSLFVDGPLGFFTGKLWTSQYNDDAGWRTNTSWYETLRIVDVRGDGRPDVCGRRATGLFCANGDGDKFINPVDHGLFTDAAGWSANRSLWGTIQFADINGDGRLDVCARHTSGIMCATAGATSFSALTLWSTTFRDTDGTASNEAYWGTLRFPDLNGDGRADLCGRNAAGILCALSTGTAFGAATQWTTDYADASGWTAVSHWKTIQFPDLNGDNKADICGRWTNGVRCGLSTGTSFGSVTRWSDRYGDDEGWDLAESDYSTIQFGDLNGDGKDDVCGRNVFGVMCGYSTGVAFEPIYVKSYSFSDDEGFADGPQYYSTIKLADVNGDGKDDICGRGPNGIRCALGGSNVPVEATLWTSSYADSGGWFASPSHWRTIQFVDLNQDGRADVCGRASAGMSCMLSAI